MNDNSKIFESELLLIQNEVVREFVEQCLDNAPDYFYTMPASTTGKYHPAYSLGEGGLVRHTKAAVKIAADLLSLDQNNDMCSDEIIAGLILHDIIKKGKDTTGFSVAEHPLLAVAYISEQYEKFVADAADDNALNIGVSVNIILRVVSTHMGQWNKDYKTGKVIMNVPVRADERFVHMCDYLASRKYLTVEGVQ